MSRAGEPTDNPVNESLNGWIKEELMTDFHLAESHDLKQTITRYVDFYNTERPAYSLGYMTPKMFYKAFMDGKIEHRDTFSNRELSEIPKFVRKKMKEKAELNIVNKSGAWFAYEGNKEKVLSHVNLQVKAGEYVALVGSSGAGKTTLCSLIPRFYDVTEGRVLLDGEDIRNLKLQSLRSHIGIVQQDVYLFAFSMVFCPFSSSPC